MAGSACTRFGVFEAGQESARDPKYTVVPQRQRLDRAAPDLSADHPSPCRIRSGRVVGATRSVSAAWSSTTMVTAAVGGSR